MDIWNIPDVPYLVVYEDGVEVEQNKKQLVFNRYAWELFTLSPNTPIISTCDCKYIMNSEYYNADTHIRLLETIFKHICEYNNLHAYSAKEPLLRLVMRIVNLIRNEVVTMISPWVFIPQQYSL
jgi:hypothetical protein